MPPQEKQKVKEDSDVESTQSPAIKDADGTVLSNGKYRCTCGSTMKNARHNISSHNSKFHRGSESAYKKDNASIEHKCKECGRVCPNFHTLVAHARKVHRFKGSSKVLKVNNAEHDGNAGNEDDVGNDDDADKESEEPAE